MSKFGSLHEYFSPGNGGGGGMSEQDIKERIIRRYEETRRAIDAGTPMDSAILAAALIEAELVIELEKKIDFIIELIKELASEAHDFDESEMDGRSHAYGQYKRRKAERESRTKPRR